MVPADRICARIRTAGMYLKGRNRTPTHKHQRKLRSRQIEFSKTHYLALYTNTNRFPANLTRRIRTQFEMCPSDTFDMQLSGPCTIQTSFPSGSHDDNHAAVTFRLYPWCVRTNSHIQSPIIKYIKWGSIFPQQLNSFPKWTPRASYVEYNSRYGCKCNTHCQLCASFQFYVVVVSLVFCQFMRSFRACFRFCLQPKHSYKAAWNCLKLSEMT